MELGLWLFASVASKRIAIVDLSRPADVHPGPLAMAGTLEQHKHTPLVTARVFPWVMGIRGLIDPAHVASLLEFLDIPQQCLQSAIDRSLMGSVQDVYYIHQVRFCGLQGVTRRDRILEDSDSDEGNISELSIGRACKRLQEYQLTKEGADSTAESEDDPEMEGRTVITNSHQTAKRQQKRDTELPYDNELRSPVQSGALPKHDRHSPRAGGPICNCRRRTGEPTMRTGRVRISEAAEMLRTVDSSSEPSDSE
jgi:hypothetical protein